VSSFEELRAKLSAYSDAFLSALPSRADKKKFTAKATDGIDINPKEVTALRQMVEDVETTTQFETLVKETARSFSLRDDKQRFVDLWSENVRAFFRRSHFYLAAYKRRVIDRDHLLANYVKAFVNKQTIVRYLVPLEFVEFDQQAFEFDSFRVCRFGNDDLKSILQNDVNRIFYPYAYAETAILSEIWFLDLSETVDAWQPGSGGPAGIRGPELRLKSTEFEAAIENALKHLALFDWGTYDAAIGATQPSKLIPKLDTGWDRFHVPFVITLHGNEIWAPNVLPDVKKLSTQPDHNWDGEEIGERPVVSMFIEGAEFRATIEEAGKTLKTLESHLSKEWVFLDAALSYLVKGFFADGLDQLLWHFVAIECLLGDRDSSLTKRLAKRVAFVVADNDQGRARIRKLITSPEGLYQLRSDLVHGNSELLQKKVYLGHLRETRELARKSVFWFLQTLGTFNERHAASRMPTREELIAALDVFSDDKIVASSVQAVMALFANLSAEPEEKAPSV